MQITNLKKLRPKKLIVFDLDGTLAKSKTIMDREMVRLLQRLLMSHRVAVIGGGKYGLFKEQLMGPLSPKKDLAANLFLFPTTATAFYQYNKGWKKVYYHPLTKAERALIKKTFRRVFTEIGYRHPAKTYGPVIEDRGTQVTFSALGQEVVAQLGKKGLRMKDDWRDVHTPTKLKIARLMQKYLPKLEVRAAGHTSVDVTKKGIDKAFGLKQIEKYLKVKIKDMLFIGDAIFPGGNDYAVTKTKVDYMKVKGPEDTKRIIKTLLK
ncbi:MAG TPA: HAD-IIB family hydrolase [Candidatus Doudnabacteria bacterium]|nr:HAD-IIB family hydrolase [Candidatus Doudnabacteria bacterium]